MKLSSKVRLLNSLGLFNLVRDISYHFSPQKKAQIEFYSRFISKGDLCFDVGANIGQKVDVFTKIGANVIAVEPQPECASYLKKKYAGSANVTVEQTALDETEGEKKLLINEANALSSMSEEWINKTRENQRFEGLEWKKGESVKTTTLDFLIQKHGTPKFCKIDVEGYELNVIKGLSRPIEYISLECTPENTDNLIAIIRHLEKLGKAHFQFCSWDNYALAADWKTGESMVDFLKTHPPEKLTGDIYAKSS